MPSVLTAKQAKQLSKLRDIPTAQLSEKQAKLLASLASKPPAPEKSAKKRQAETSESAAPAASAVPAAAPSESAAPAASAVPAAPAKRAAGPCTDEGKWGADGQWEYPPDRQIVCASCANSFTFTGKEASFLRGGHGRCSRRRPCAHARPQPRRADV